MESNAAPTPTEAPTAPAPPAPAPNQVPAGPGELTKLCAKPIPSDSCSLSDDCQTIFRCLSDVPPDICQLPLDSCQISTTYTIYIYASQMSGGS